ncbi:hypothetical protein MBT84_32865 [Streptomyces sp. MBT84]|uniref:hypothetical protein n=1 Tax=Streptomyces sp. MBT84 TaxID=1488414 RepID=UPI001C6E0269|nr:hypothetical protein [Streptomyces sp. MBT84]MBW8704402.1 hypothetical protein [Streptomyces sp. MBT84]
MCRDTRTTEQIQGAISAAADLAKYIENDPMSTPQNRQLAEELHNSINNNLDTLDERRSR